MRNFWLDKSEITDYVLLMLGAPIIKVELDPQNIDMAVKSANITFAAYAKMSDVTLSDAMTQKLMQEGTLAYAKLMLGHIRRKYTFMIGPDSCKGKLDGQLLLSDAKEDIRAFEEKLMWAFGITKVKGCIKD